MPAQKLLLPLLLLLASLTTSAQPNMDQLAQLTLRNIGPANMSGRITTLDAVTANPKTIYAVAASGGIWESENGGKTWRSMGLEATKTIHRILNSPRCKQAVDKGEVLSDLLTQDLLLLLPLPSPSAFILPVLLSRRTISDLATARADMRYLI